MQSDMQVMTRSILRYLVITLVILIPTILIFNIPYVWLVVAITVIVLTWIVLAICLILKGLV